MSETPFSGPGNRMQPPPQSELKPRNEIEWLIPLMMRGRRWQVDEQAFDNSHNDSTSLLLGEENTQLIEQRLQTSTAGAVVLELGAGEAKSNADLKQLYPHIRPVAIDLSTADASRSVQNISADIEHLPLGDNTIDIAYSAMTLCYISDKLRALSEVWRVLKPGGASSH